MEDHRFTVERRVLKQYTGSAPEVTVPASVKKIGEYAFMNCASVRKIVIPDSVEQICPHAFSGCSSLENIVIPETVERIESDAFRDCVSLKSVVLPRRMKSFFGLAGCSSLESIVMPESIEDTDALVSDRKELCLFRGCTNLRNVMVSDEMLTKCGKAFYGTPFYDSLIDEHGLLVIGDRLVSCGYDAASAEIPGHVTVIGDYAFKGCSALKKITIPEQVVRIGEEAFAYCGSLESVVIPGNVKEIGPCAFYWCEALKEPEFGDGVEKIEEEAFSLCHFRKVSIPSSVTYVGRDAFSPDVHVYWNRPSRYVVSVHGTNDKAVNERIEYVRKGDALTLTAVLDKKGREVTVIEVRNTDGEYLGELHDSPYTLNMLGKAIGNANATVYSVTPLSVRPKHSKYALMEVLILPK